MCSYLTVACMDVSEAHLVVFDAVNTVDGEFWIIVLFDVKIGDR